MRILFIISSLNTGGAQRALSSIVTNLPDEWEIDILLNNTCNIVYPYRGKLIDLCIREPSSRKSIFYQIKVLIKRLAALRELKKKGNYNACISFLDSANIANIITGRKYCKIIVSVRNNLSKRNGFIFRYVINPITKRLYNHADNVIALSKGIETTLARSFGIRANILSTIYNGFSREDIQNQAGLRLPDQIFTFITMGRCDYQKGQWHLVRAFAEFEKKHENSRLVILGDGPYVAYIKQLISAYGLEGKVLLKGFVNNPFKELVNADVFVFPSMFEGLSNATLEAMACNLPVIASDFRYGAREILAPDTDIAYEIKAGIEHAKFGIITPVCSGTKHSADVPLEPQELLLLEAMELLYTNEKLRNHYCLASKERVMDFSVEKSIEQWCEIISG